MRKTFGTGLFGDWQGRDETKREKTKRLAKRAAKEEKKGVSIGKSKGGVNYVGDKEKNGRNLVIVQGSV